MMTVLLRPDRSVSTLQTRPRKRLERGVAMLRDGDVVPLSRIFVNRYLAPPVVRLAGQFAVSRGLRDVRQRETGRPVLLLCSTMDWAAPCKQRPHHLAAALARRGVCVFYITPRTGHDSLLGIRRVRDHLYLADLTPALLDATPSPAVMLLSTDGRLTVDLFTTLREHGARLLYDFIDAFDPAVVAIPVESARGHLHRQLLADESVFVVSSARALHEEVGTVRRRNMALVPNAVDYAHFEAPRAAGAFRREFQVAIERGRPIAGYFGAIASWIDVELLKELARQRPGFSVVVIGADHDGARAELARDRPDNLLLVPTVPYRELPRYGAWFDVALVPFRAGAIAEATSPLKLYEYMALGLPIVSTPIPEARRHDCVWIAEDRSAFLRLCDRAVARGGDQQMRERLRQEARANSWDVRADALVEALTSAGFLVPGS